MTDFTDMGTLAALVLLGSTALALPICLLLLRRYRRIVAEEMARATSRMPSSAEPRHTANDEPWRISLKVDVIRPSVAPASSAAEKRFLDKVRQRTIANGALYLLAASAFAAVMTYGWVVSMGDDGRSFTKLSWLFWVYVWPAPLSFVLIMATSRRGRVAALIAYAIVLVALGVRALMRNPGLTVGQLAMLWLLLTLVPTIVLAAVMFRRIRTVGPLVLPPLALVLIAFVLLAIMLPFWPSVAALIEKSWGLLPQDSGTVSLMLFLGGAATLFALAWSRIRSIAIRYERRELSEEGFQIDTIFLFFAVIQSVSMTGFIAIGLLFGLFAYTAYRAVMFVGMRALGKFLPAHDGFNLLLLRVFRLERKSERLFSILRPIWLRQGRLSMIAGPDLAGSIVGPHEIVQFIQGRLRRQFVHDVNELNERLRNFDRRPLADGSYRINVLYCSADIWQRAVEHLMKDADAVLMDLRSFSPVNEGCAYELARLLDVVSLERVLFLIDRSTDRAYLEDTLKRLWAACAPDSPNRQFTAPTARLFECDTVARPVIVSLIHELLAFQTASASDARFNDSPSRMRAPHGLFP